MSFEVVPLEIAHLKKLLVLPSVGPVTPKTLEDSYFSTGSSAYCLLADGDPVFAGGVVNLQWRRGEAWIVPNAFFRSHQKTCFRILKNMLPEIAARSHFRRIQAVCSPDVRGTLFAHLGFTLEGTLQSFGPFGEPCRMYARIFDK